MSNRSFRSLKALTLALVLVSIGSVASGCQWGEVGTSPLILKDRVATKKDVYERLGVPDDIFITANDSRLLLYNNVDERGTFWGAGWGLAPILLFGHSHTATDTTWVTIDKNGRVTDAGVLKNAELAHFRIWPFGE